MLALLMSLVERAAQWGPNTPIIAISALAVIQAMVLPRRLWAKAAWAVAVLGCAMFAGAVATHQSKSRAETNQVAVDAEVLALHGLWGQLDTLSRTLPSPPEEPAKSFDTIDEALSSLSVKVATIESQIAALREQAKGRSLDDDTAAKLADYLRQYGSFSVVVSCVPDDVEAYTYANQLANILRTAGWDARGPQTTAILQGAAAMGVSLYVRDPRSPGAAKILVDAFTRFNIPYQTGIAATNAIPDTATVELVVAKKP
jgi:hypothetical protein